MTESDDLWARERGALLGRRISDLGLRVEGTPVEALARRLYGELEARGVVFRPPVYLTDEWGCPEGVPVIGVPFFLADRRLERLEREHAVELEEEDDPMRIMRHEAGHAFNYAYRLYERPDWRHLFGPYSRPYRDRYRVDPSSREHVRHIQGWYAQKHPDEDFAETFAVWLTPDEDWRALYAGWPVLRKLGWVDDVMSEIGPVAIDVPHVDPEHLPVDAMERTLAQHYEEWSAELPIEHDTSFDADLRNIFRRGSPGDAADGGTAADFIRAHRKELVGRISYWTGEASSMVRQFVDLLAERAAALSLEAGRREASMLIELTAFGTAVMMNYRHTGTTDGGG